MHLSLSGLGTYTTGWDTTDWLRRHLYFSGTPGVKFFYAPFGYPIIVAPIALWVVGYFLFGADHSLLWLLVTAPIAHVALGLFARSGTKRQRYSEE